MRYRIVLFIAGLAVGALVAPAGTNGIEGRLTVEELVERVVESDPQIINSGRLVEEALRSYELTRAQTLPDLDVVITPYSWDRRRIPEGSDEVITRTQSVGVGLAVGQALPTSGVVTAGVSNTLDFVSGSTDAVQQTPEATLGVSQPLFVAGDFIGTDVYRAGLRNARIGYERSLVSDRLTRNGNIRTALALYVRVNALRRDTIVLEETVDVIRRQIEVAEIDREQGLASDNTLLALQVTLNGRREALFDTQLALVEAEQSLARLLGIDDLAGLVLDDQFTLVEVAEIEAVRDAVSASPEVDLRRLAAEQSRKQSLLNELTDRPQLDVSVRVRPLYPENRSDPEDFTSSWSDYFEDGSDLEAAVALSLTVPLITSRERSRRERIDELAQLRAETDLTDTQLTVANRLRTLLINRRFLSQRLELLAVDVEFERQRVEDEQTLLEAGATTPLRVEEVELDLLSRSNELWRAEAELFLNAVEIRAVQGDDLQTLFAGA